MLNGVTTAIGVDAVLCVAAAVAITVFLRTPGQESAGWSGPLSAAR